MPRSNLRARGASADYWPGFVDAMASLLLVIIFLLSVFMLSQFFLSQAITGKDEALNRLNAQIADLVEQLNLQKTKSLDMQETIEQLRASLSLANASLASAEDELASAQGQLASVGMSLEEERNLSKAAQDQAALLNQQIAALRQQLAALQAALDASEAKDEEQQAVIADLGKRLNAALAQKVQELSRYRSEFFGRLREILSDRAGIEVVGDRFIFQSEVLFDSGSAELKPEGRQELRKLAIALLDISRSIPTELNWVLRVDGHTDDRPINTVEFPSNWYLSTARAISVINFLRSEGVPGERLVAAGFGEYHPLDASGTVSALQRNRRIEFKLTER